MSLKINGRNIQSLPLRFRGAVGFEYAETNKSSQRNIYASEGITDDASGNPSGHLYPSAWIWPQKPGSITSYRLVFGTSTVSSIPAAGVGIVSSVSALATATATATLLFFGSGSSAGASTVSGDGSLSAPVSTTINGTSTATATGFSVVAAPIATNISASSTASATWNAKAFIEISSSGSASATATPTARGFVECDITPFTELSPQSLATYVWNAPTAGNTETGTMGRLLYDAGGGASPELIAAAVWAELLASNQDADSFGEAIQYIKDELDGKLKTSIYLATK